MKHSALNGMSISNPTLKAQRFIWKRVKVLEEPEVMDDYKKKK